MNTTILPCIHSYLSRPASSVKRIALVGGPKGGKSTFLDYILMKYGSKVCVVSETATLFFSSGITAPPEDSAEFDTWLTRLQPAIFLTQILRELDAMLAAIRQGAQVIAYDRGTADCIAYLPGHHAQFAEVFPGISVEELYNQYDEVYHFESLATANPALFDTEGNDTRYEDLPRAQKVEYAARLAWQDHPRYHFLDGTLGIEHVLNQAHALIQPHVEVEESPHF